MMTQALIEILIMLSGAAFLGFKIGRLWEQRQTRALQHRAAQQAQRIRELEFDFNYCTQTRRRIQRQLRALQQQETEVAQTPVLPAAVDMHGKVVMPQQKEETAPQQPLR